MRGDLEKPDSPLARLLLGSLRPHDGASIKACCASLYSHPAARWLLGDSFHPGGEALTRYLGGLLGLSPASRVLDAASGPGTSAEVLAQAFRSQVVGLDLGMPGPGWSQDDGSPPALVTFCRGDAEALPFADETFDAIICECSFCLLPDKRRAAAEFRRVLRRRGHLGISDVTVAVDAPTDGFRDVLSWVACVADARPRAEYESLLVGAGFAIVHREDQTAALAATLSHVRKKLLLLQVAAKVGEVKLGKNGDAQALTTLSLASKLVAEGLSLAKQAQSMLEQGLVGYCLLVAEKE